MGRIGMTEILLILVVVVLLFGGRKIPELMKGIGQGMKEFKKASKFDPAGDDKDTEHKN
jgi:sec-independent protein translocase protein TatA